ncbi:hypothetical protein D031_0012A, partial [Vibrio parahaemolyticus VP-48]|jgi:hypothetical protein
MRTK